MEKQQSVIDRLTEMMVTMKKETSDLQVCVTSENSAKVTCQFCDKSGHTAKQCLRIRNKAKEPIRCFNCGREGHKQTQCRSKRKKLTKPSCVGITAGRVETVQSSTDKLTSVNLLGNYIPIKVGHLRHNAMLDSGADINVRNLSCRKLKSDKKFITAVDNQRVPILFFIFVNIEIRGHRFNVTFYVVSDLHPNVILGLEFLKSQNIVLDFKNKKLHFDPRRQLVLENEISVPPKSEIIVVAKL